MKNISRWLVITFLFIFTFNNIKGAKASELEEFSSTVEVEEVEEVSEELVEETSLTEDFSETTQIDSLGEDYKEYIPFGQFVNYQYMGDGINFERQDIIMEYAPDVNGIFQFSAVTDNTAVAYVYQIREDGLYELAKFPDYYIVEDLRYSNDASDGIMSLILPKSLQVGVSYQSGYANEKSRYIAELIPEYYFGGHYFNNVYRIDETQTVDGVTEYYRYYYAPSYGLIVVEKIDNNGQNQLIMQIISTQGSLN